MGNKLTLMRDCLPRDHGIRVAASGHFPFVLAKPTGSLATEIWARLIALQIGSFKSAWRCCRAVLRLQDKPRNLWRPFLFHKKNMRLASSQFQSEDNSNTYHVVAQPQSNWCYWRSHKSVAWMRRWRMWSLSLNRIDVISGAISQSPEWGDDADKHRASSTSEETLQEMSASWLSTIGQSHTFCVRWNSGSGSGTHEKLVHELEVSHTSSSGLLMSRVGRMKFWSDSVDTAEPIDERRQLHYIPESQASRTNR